MDQLLLPRTANSNIRQHAGEPCLGVHVDRGEHAGTVLVVTRCKEAVEVDVLITAGGRGLVVAALAVPDNSDE